MVPPVHLRLGRIRPVQGCLASALDGGGEQLDPLADRPRETVRLLRGRAAGKECFDELRVGDAGGPPREPLRVLSQDAFGDVARPLAGVAERDAAIAYAGDELG